MNLESAHIEEIRLENFKCFKKIEIKTGNLMLLTGANSSGKSSILHALVGTLQSENFPFQFSTNGKYIKMGGYDEIVHSNDTASDITIGYTISSMEGIIDVTSKWKFDSVRNLPELKHLSVSSDFYELIIEKIVKYSLKFNYFREKDPNPRMRDKGLFEKFMSSLDIFSEEKSDKSKGKNPIERRVERMKNDSDVIEFKFTNLENLDNELYDRGYYILETIIRGLRQKFNSLDESMNFLSSFRLYPERTYYETSKFDVKIGKFGENYEDQIIAWETKKDSRYKELLETVNSLGLFSDVKTKRLGGGRFEILVRTKSNGVWSSITDVGFGISQFLPIIVADLQLGKGSTLALAQPELHLHPEIQAQFADYVVEQIRKNGKRYIIETHSEYLLNRIRLAISKNVIKVNNVKPFFLENNGRRTKKFSLSFQRNGKIRSAPDNFFKTYMLDVMNIAISAK